MLERNGLEAISGHFPFDRLANDLEGVVRDAKALGLEYAGCAWITHEGEFDEKECLNAASVFNRAGRALANQNIKFFYHTHGYEFRPHGDGTLFDLFMAETDPEYVRLQMDVFWVAHPGHDPVKVLRQYGNRFELMHVKDMKNGLVGTNEMRSMASVPLEAGTTYIPARFMTPIHVHIPQPTNGTVL